MHPLLSIERLQAWQTYLDQCRESLHYDEQEAWFWSQLQDRLGKIEARQQGRRERVVA